MDADDAGGLELDRRALQLFEEVLDLSAERQRARLEAAFSQEPALRPRVEALLGASDQGTLRDAIAREAADLLQSGGTPQILEAGIGNATGHAVESRELEAGDTGDETALEGLLARLAERRPPTPRYEMKGELARGGMGKILRAWDPTIRRELAVKVLHGSGPSSRAESDASKLARFLEEAQVTGQLQHPGIVSVHELGMDHDGRVFFSMPLVRGEDLSDLLEAMRQGHEEWTQTRILGVLLRACEAMAYAHSKKVIHRDLKPSNIRVGRFGEVYVMDWGIARVLGRDDRHDLRFRASENTQTLNTERHNPSDESSGRLLTMDGRVVGTPYYMSLEQAEGRLDAMGPHSDVYALGAMLYETLAGNRPYHRPGATVSPYTVLAAVLDRPPRPLRELNPAVPPELAAICEKAMCREVAERYRDTVELADDLRAYLEQRVVKAYSAGPIAELRKWIQRNRAVALTAAAALLISVGLLSLMWWREARLGVELQDSNRSLDAARQEAERHLQDHRRLADINELQRLKVAAAQLWPAWPDRIPEMQRWILEAEELAAQLPLHQEFQRSLGAVPSPGEDGGLPRRERWLPDLVRSFVAELEAFSAGSGDEGLSELRRRLDRARHLEARSVDEPTELWDEAINEIALDERFDGLELTPQMGLVPLGPDPRTGLWEFAVLDTGSIPDRHETEGHLELDDDFAIVLVLLPPTTFLMGAQADDPDGPQYEEVAIATAPLHEVHLKAHFLGKYELSQSQYQQLRGRRPSFHPDDAQQAAAVFGEAAWRRLPVEQIDHFEAREALRRVGLVLPTEAQFEAATRAGSSSRWWCGEDAASIGRERAGNLFERTGHSVRADDLWGQPLPWRDDHAKTAPVGSYAPNELGLHDTIGNVFEWCRDWYGDYDLAARDGDGLRQVPAELRSHRSLRGGAFDTNALPARSSFRDRNTPDTKSYNLGCRAARPLLAEGERWEPGE